MSSLSRPRTGTRLVVVEGPRHDKIALFFGVGLAGWCGVMCARPPADFRLVTEEGEDGDEAAYVKIMSLMEETNENGVLEPYYNMSYGYYYLDRSVLSHVLSVGHELSREPVHEYEYRKLHLV